MSPSTNLPTVVLVHGFPGGSADYGKLTDELVRRGWAREQVLTPDLVGFGSRAGDHTFDELWVTSQSRHLELLLANEGKVILVGHDFGGPIALTLAARLGSRVQSLIVMSCNLLSDPPLPGPFRLLSAPLLGPIVESIAFSGMSMRAMGRFGRRGGPRPHRNTPSEVAAIHTIFATALKNPVEHFGPVQSNLQTYAGPITVLIGDRDPFFGVGHAERQAFLARESHLEVLHGTGHFPQLEAPSAIAELIERAAA